MVILALIEWKGTGLLVGKTVTCYNPR